jgi:hypothetical protein
MHGWQYTKLNTVLFAVFRKFYSLLTL